MAIPLEKADLFIKTFIDFWTLRPRQFLSERQNNPGTYMSSGQFLVLSVGVIFATVLAAVTLAPTLEGTTGQKLDPKAITGYAIVLMIVTLGINSVLLYVVARLPPSRSKPSLASIFELNCYMMSVAIPSIVIYYLILPIMFFFVSIKEIPIWSVFISQAILLAVSLFYFFVYNLPGLAFISGVRTRSVVFAYFVLMVMIFVASVIVGFIAGLTRAFLR